MDIKDVAGLSKPITKLIEVSAKGLGNLTEAYFSRKRTDANVYQIEKTSAAIVAVNKSSLTRLEFSDGDVNILCDKASISPAILEEYVALGERSEQRVLNKEIERQVNIENTLYQAADELKGDDSITDEPVNDDWISRYFNTVEDISSEEMQKLWGKVLAGELRKPSTYSLRTLDLLRNLTTDEAELFCKLGSLTVRSGNDQFVWKTESIESEYGIKFTDLILLKDIGLVYQDELAYSAHAKEAGETSVFILGNKAIIVEREQSTPKYSFSTYFFTRAGQELLNLIPAHEMTEDDSYIKEIVKKIKSHGSPRILFADCLALDDVNTVRYFNSKEI